MPFEETETVVNASVQTTSDDKISVEEFVAQMSHDDRTVAITAGRELWKLVRLAGRPSARDERADVESQLRLALGDNRPNDVDREILWMLSEIGGDKSVDAVAARLSNHNLREDARMALERIPGEKSLAALRSAFDVAGQDFKSNIVQSLRARGVQIEGTPCQKLLPVKESDVRPIVSAGRHPTFGFVGW